jgi:hypothetical protein
MFVVCPEDSSHRAPIITDLQVQFLPLALDPATRNTLMQAVADCLPCVPNASVAERGALRAAAFALVGQLCPTDPVEAMLTAEIVAAHYTGMHAFQCAARPDPPYDLQLRYQASGRSLGRLTSAKRRELLRHQAAQATLPAGFAAAHAAQAPATAPSAPARPAAPASRAEAAAAGQRAAGAAPAAAQRRRDTTPLQATVNQLVAKAATDPEDAELEAPTEAEVVQLIATSYALLAETAPPAEDLGARLQAEVDARKAAATKLAA